MLSIVCMSGEECTTSWYIVENIIGIVGLTIVWGIIYLLMKGMSE